MPSKDLRSFLKELEDKRPEELIRIKKEVDPHFEIPAVLQKLESLGRFPAVFFENVKNSRFPVISNLFASDNRLALAIETTKERAIDEYWRRQNNPLPTRLIDHGPVKEVVLRDEEVDMNEFPIVTHNEKDAGPYVTAGVSIMKDPETGLMNCGIYRIQLKGKRKLGLMIVPAQMGAYIYRKHEEMDKPMDITIAVGHHPALAIAAVGKIRPKLEVAGGILGESLEVVKCETSDLLAPANAELLIEGTVAPHLREKEGPFGEYTRYYGDEMMSLVINVTAVCHREDMIYHDVFAAHKEHLMVGKLSWASGLLSRLRANMPAIKAVNTPRCYWAFVSMKKTEDGEPIRAAFEVFAAHHDMKYVIVVDDDVDIFNEEEVWWAVATRLRADKRMWILPRCQGTHLDPTSYDESGMERGSMVTKVIFDATKPLSRPFPEKTSVPKSLLDSIDLEEYLKAASKVR